MSAQSGSGPISRWLTSGFLYILALVATSSAAATPVLVVNLGPVAPVSVNNNSEILLLHNKSLRIYTKDHSPVRVAVNSSGNAVLNDHEHIMFSRGQENNIDTLIWTRTGVRRVPLPSRGVGFNNHDDIMMNDRGGIYLRTGLGKTKWLVPGVVDYNLIGTSITDYEHIVGVMTGPFRSERYRVRPFAWVGSKVRFLPYHDGTFMYPFAINNRDQIVGEYRPNHGSVEHFAIYYPHTGAQPVVLDSLLGKESGWHLDRAIGINDRGQIVGLGYFHGHRSGFTLKLPLPTLPDGEHTRTATPAHIGGHAKTHVGR